MNIFDSILQKLGIQKPAAVSVKPSTSVSAGASVGKPAPAASANIGAPVATAPGSAPYATAEREPAKPAPMPMVDVVSKLDTLAKSHPGADWKVSIADLLRMLGFEHSYEYRKELATELGCPSDIMADSARMNVWLHKTVLQKISENGGNIPTSLLS